jgi:hypothetical protein
MNSSITHDNNIFSLIHAKTYHSVVQDFNYTIADHFKGIYGIFSQINKEKPEDVNL